MTIAFVQDNQVNATGTSTTCAFPSNNTAGNAIVVAVRVGVNATVTVTDSAGNTYTQDRSQLESFGGDVTVVASAFNIAGSANTVTISQSGASASIRGAIHEYSGLATTHANAFDVAISAINSGTTNTAADSGTATTTNANDLLFGAVATNIGVTCTPGMMGTGSSATARETVASGKLSTFDTIVSSTSSGYRANATLASADNWTAIMVAYKAAPPSGTNALAGNASDTTTGTGTLTAFASVVLTSPLYNGVGGLFDPNFWVSSIPVVGNRVFYDPAFITVAANGEINSTSNNCKAVVEFFDGSVWQIGIVVIVPSLAGYAKDTTSGSGVLSPKPGSSLSGSAVDLTSATGMLSGGISVAPVLTPSTLFVISILPRTFTITIPPRAFTVSDGVQRFDIKDPTESVALTFNFLPDLATGEHLTGVPSVSVSVLTGSDNNPTATLNGQGGFDALSQQVVQPVTGGVDGCEYEYVVVATTSNPNKTLALRGVLPVRQ